MRTGWEAVKLGIVAFIVPFIFVISPSLLAEGALWETGVDFTTALMGVFAISAALRGFVVAPIGIRGRVGLAVAAVALFLPLGLASAAWLANALGLAVGSGIVGQNLRGRVTL